MAVVEGQTPPCPKGLHLSNGVVIIAAMSSSQTISNLNRFHGVVDALHYDADEAGMARAQLRFGGGEATLYLQGAHLTSWRPAGAVPVLFLSRSARFEKGVPIRGGIPLCFPWFGAKVDDPEAPSHGLARTSDDWDVSFVGRTDDSVIIALEAIYMGLRTRYQVELGSSLSLTFDVTNILDVPQTFEQVFHSYFTVSDVREVSLTGLEDAEYLDQLEGRERRPASGEALRFSGETDRIYLATGSEKVIHDSGLERTIIIEAEGSPTTVVWNPWDDKTARLDDLDDDEWPTMLCVETGAVADDAIELPPGESRSLKTVLSLGA